LIMEHRQSSSSRRTPTTTRLFMAYLWMVGAVFYYFRYERPPKSHRDLPHSGLETPPLLPLHPLVTIVVPCHNEGRDIEDTVEYLLATTYPNFDILLVNDGSNDENTADPRRARRTTP